MNVAIKLFRSCAGGLRAVVDFYVQGFREMTVGRTLWLIILLKVFIFFVIMKLLFFPNKLATEYDSDEARAEHVRYELTGRH